MEQLLGRIVTARGRESPGVVHFIIIILGDATIVYPCSLHSCALHRAHQSENSAKADDQAVVIVLGKPKSGPVRVHLSNSMIRGTTGETGHDSIVFYPIF